MKNRNIVSLILILPFIIFLVAIPVFPGQNRVEENTAAPDSAIKNVLVIILDALRADHLGIYGYHRNTSPNIDALARKGLVFDRAIVQAGWTKPSVTSYSPRSTRISTGCCSPRKISPRT